MPTEHADEKKTARGGLEMCGALSPGQQGDQSLAAGVHGVSVSKDVLPNWIVTGVLLLGLYGVSHGLAQASGLQGASVAQQQIPVSGGHLRDAGPIRPAHLDELGSHSVGLDVVLVSAVAPNGEAIAKNEPDQAGDQRGGKLDNRTTQQLLETLLLHCAISFSVSLLLGYFWGRRPWL